LLFIGVGHLLMILATDYVPERELLILRGRWDLVISSTVFFLIPVRLKCDCRAHGRTWPS